MFGLFKKKKTTKNMAMNDEFKLQLIGATVQWQRGPLTGRLNKIERIDVEGAFEYVFFTDGTKEMSIKFPDWFIPLDNLADAPIPIIYDEQPISEEAGVVMNNPDISQVDPSLVPNFQQPSQGHPLPKLPPVIEKDPLIVLLDKQKREETEITFKLKLNIPNPNSMKILQDSFEGFDESLLNWLKNDTDIINSILDEIKNTLIK